MRRGGEPVFRGRGHREFAFGEQLGLEEIRDGIRFKIGEPEIDTAQHHR